MSFKLEVGKVYSVVADDAEVVGLTTIVSLYPKVTIVGRKSDKKLKVLFVGSNDLEYSSEGHVIGFQEHIYDLQPRKTGLK